MPKNIACIVILALVYISSQESRAQPKIGVLASYSGPWGAYGEAYRRGIELADVGSKATFIYEEDGFVPAKSVSAFRKLLNADKISAVLVGDTVTAQAVSPIALKNKIPLYSWASSDGVFANNPYGLRLWTSNAKDLAFITEEITRRGYKKLALFTSTHTYTNMWATELEARFPGSHWDDFSKPPESFQTNLIKVRNGGYDAIGVCMGSPMNGQIAKQLKDLKINIPLFGCNFLEATADIRVAAGAFSGVWFTSPKLSANFVQKYKEKFGFTDHIISAAVFHDGALLATGTKDKPFALEGLREVNENGDRHLDFDFQIVQFQDNDIVFN